MTIHEAREALNNGYKITHRYFTDNEYLHKGKNGTETEDGYKVDWSYYLGLPLAFGDGWSIFEG